MSNFRGRVSGNSVRAELLWCNVCCRFVGLILVIGFVLEVIGLTYGKLIIFVLWFVFGFVDRLSQLSDTCFMLRVMRFLEADKINDPFLLV